MKEYNYEKKDMYESLGLTQEEVNEISALIYHFMIEGTSYEKKGDPFIFNYAQKTEQLEKLIEKDPLLRRVCCFRLFQLFLVDLEKCGLIKEELN